MNSEPGKGPSNIQSCDFSKIDVHGSNWFLATSMSVVTYLRTYTYMYEGMYVY
jgi:hypothetical protein